MANKISIIGTVGLPAKYGGFETLTEYLTKHLGGKLDLTVFCSSKSYNQQLEIYNNARLYYLPIDANGIQSIFYDIVSMFKALRFADTFLILGVSGCIVLPLIRLISRKKIVVNIDGLEWKRAKWNRLAKWFLKFSEKLAVKFSDEVITDNKAIQDYVTEEYGAESTLIAYGGDHARKVTLSDDIQKKYQLPVENYAFSVCRIEPENNVHVVLEAFSRMNSPLFFVGNWNYSEYGKLLREQYSSYSNIHLLDPIYDQDILDQLRSNASVYIHGHSAGGTNPSLVEAMYLGLPVVAFDIDYNRETTENKALYFITPEDLIDIVVKGKTRFPEIKIALKDIAMARYRWEIIVKQYENILLSH
jgi:glycosyltransferase involved in cell wall biosynthesis